MKGKLGPTPHRPTPSIRLHNAGCGRSRVGPEVDIFVVTVITTERSAINLSTSKQEGLHMNLNILECADTAMLATRGDDRTHSRASQRSDPT
jgi:hypothetical protein